jgi:hypothetical protein
MTTEVAVLNKLAVALAADSAATIDTGRSRKIYNTANKIFDISDAQPIGMMIYGNLEFMGLPFELVVKDFRKKNSQLRHGTVSACVSAFIDYLANEVSVTSDAEDDLVVGLVSSALAQLGNSVFNRIINRDLGQGNPDSGSSTFEEFVNRELTVLLQEIRGHTPASCFSGLQANDILNRYAPQLEMAVGIGYRGFQNDATRNLLYQISAELIFREQLSDSRTGMALFGLDVVPSSIRREPGRWHGVA